MKRSTFLSCLLLIFAVASFSFVSFTDRQKETKPVKVECEKQTRDLAQVKSVDYTCVSCHEPNAFIDYSYSDLELPRSQNFSKAFAEYPPGYRKVNIDNYNKVATINKPLTKQFRYGTHLRC